MTRRAANAIEHLSSLDSVFLAVEDSHNPMNIGSIGFFDGPAPPFSDVVDLLSERIARLQRCRQRVREPRGPVGRPLWIDAVDFAVESHIHRVQLSADSFASLDDVVAQIIAEPLDRRHPLWEIHVVDGLDDGRWAILAKAHHCMVDGIAGSDLLGAILGPDMSALPNSLTPSPNHTALATAAGREPTESEILWFGARQSLRTVLDRALGAAALLAHPRRTWRRTRDIVGAARRLWMSPRHIDTSLVGEIGTTRRWTGWSVPLEDIAAIRAGLGGTLNDVVIAAVTLGLREFLIGRGEIDPGERSDARTITAMVPVSVRDDSERARPGNRVANVHAALPVGTEGPVTTLRRVRQTLDDLKTSHEVEATGLFLRIGDYVPRVVADRVSRTVLHRQRDVQIVITNVPGPRHELRLGPYRMVGARPVAPIGGRVRITVAVWSYMEHLEFGITADRDSTGDIDQLGRAIIRGFERLVVAAGADPGSVNVN